MRQLRRCWRSIGGAFPLLFSLFLSTGAAATISDYRPVSIPCRDAAGRLQLAIRAFGLDGTPSYLLLDPRALATTVTAAADVGQAGVDATAALAATPFSALLARTTSPPFRLQNHGLTHSMGPAAGLFLTVDLCPSRRPWERGMFEALAAIARRTGRPTPVAICITGAWLASHPDELHRLKEQERQGLLAITWVNHSLSHRYDPAAPLERNFMLTPGSDPGREILANEQAMIEQGLLPSPFFRFPGLVADEGLIRLLRQLSLIPLGADAWLAKGEQPRNGSIVLVHGNGNEPQGIARLMPLLQTAPPPLFLPLAEAISTQAEKPLDKPARPGQR